MSYVGYAASLDTLLQVVEFEDAVSEGYIRVQTHPDFPSLKIANYSEKATFDRFWNRSTRLCRGLIYDSENLQVLAVPFPKFHNYNEPEASEFDSNSSVAVYDKVDGSCGIFYVQPDGKPAIATRGSFASPQAVRATQILQGSDVYMKWAKEFIESDAYKRNTPVFEIVYSENRIVLKYDFDDLVFLGAISHTTGLISHSDSFSWPGRKARCLAFGVNLLDALSLPDRENAEGVVIRSLNSNLRFDDQLQMKVKQEDYLKLHAILTNLSGRVVWSLGYDSNINQFVATLPDEFQNWAKDVHKSLVDTLLIRESQLRASHRKLVDSLPVEYSRRDFAMIAKTSIDRGYLFSLEDGFDIKADIWKELRPVAQSNFLGVSNGI